MSNKASYFLVGLFIVGAIMVAMVLILSRPTAKIQEDQEKVFSTQDLSNVKSKTGNLENYGNLPSTLGPEDVGRENPFDSYK